MEIRKDQGTKQELSWGGGGHKEDQGLPAPLAWSHMPPPHPTPTPSKRGCG